MLRSVALGTPALAPRGALSEAGCACARAVGRNAARGPATGGVLVRSAGCHLWRDEEGCGCGSIAVEVLASPTASAVRDADDAEATVIGPSHRQIGCPDQTRLAAALAS